MLSTTATDPIWVTNLVAQRAEGLDLLDEEDRSTFRWHLLHDLDLTKVVYIRTWAKTLGATNVPTNKAGAIRALAHAYLVQQHVL